MIYRTFGKLQWNLSCVSMGTWNIGGQWGEVNPRTATKAIETALDNGVNIFDTAEGYGVPYGQSEEYLGKTLTGHRHEVFIVSKIGMYGRGLGAPTPTNHPMTIRNSAHASLHRLRTDYHDVLLCHEPNPEHPDAYLEAFDMLKQEGRLRLSGISTDNLDVLKNFNKDNTCDVVEIDYSLLNRAHEKELLDYCQEHNIGVLIRGALAKGLLSGKYDKESAFKNVRYSWNKGEKHRSWYEEQIDIVKNLKTLYPDTESLVHASLRYVMAHSAKPLPIFGAKDSEQVLMNLEAGTRLLSDDELQALKNLLA